MIVIMGATGKVGGAVLEVLRGSGETVRAISRKPRAQAEAGVDWVVADALDPDALAAAFRGADAVFVLNAAPADAADVHSEAERLSRSIAAALNRASVPYAVALSSQGAHLTGGTGVITTLNVFEQALRTTVTRLTLLRPAYFMESWVPLAHAALTTGHLPSFVHPASRAIDTVSARDVGATAAQFLLTREPGLVNVVGPAPYSDDEAAAILSELTGRRIVVATVPQSEFAAAYVAAGVGASTATALAEMYAAINGPGIPFQDADRVVKGTTTLRTVLQEAIGS